MKLYESIRLLKISQNFRDVEMVLWQAIVLIVTFIGTFYLLEIYTAGDQIHYGRFYEQSFYVRFGDVLEHGRRYLGAPEPLSLFTLWLGGKLSIDKNIFIAGLNSLLVAGFLRLSFQLKARRLAVLLLLVGFYPLVLFTGAERLKIAYIFLVWAMTFKGHWKTGFFLLALLSHFQVFLLLMAALFFSHFDEIERFVKYGLLKRIRLYQSLMLLVLGLGLAFVAWPILAHKFEAYANGIRPITELVNLLLLLLITYLVVSQKWKMVLSLSLYAPIILLIGGARVNMIAVTLAFYFYLVDQKLSTPPVLALLSYFAFKSISFIQSVVVHGHGFA